MVLFLTECRWLDATLPLPALICSHSCTMGFSHHTDGDMCGAGERARDANSGFTRYVRGLCALCTEGSFEQTLDILFMAYSTARNDGMICRTEMAAILAKHAVYDDCEVRGLVHGSLLPVGSSQNSRHLVLTAISRKTSGIRRLGIPHRIGPANGASLYVQHAVMRVRCPSN